MRVQLRDLSPGTEYALRFRSSNGDGGFSEWSQLHRFTTTNDTIAPAPITNLSWSQAGGSFAANWDAPTLDAQGNPLLDFRDFKVEIDDTENAFKAVVYTIDSSFLLTEDEHVRLFGSRRPTLRITVKARDLSYNESTPVTLISTLETPPIPSAPTLSNYLGMLNVTWNGKTSTGTNMPESFSHCEVHVSTTSNFTPDDTTYKTRIVAIGSASSAVVPGLAFGTLVYVRLVAVSKLAKKSGASVQASGTPDRVSGLDIKNNTLSKNQINFTALDIGGANAYYQATAPATGMVNGDIWYDTDDSYTTYRYNGSAWIAAPEIGMIYGKKIVVGAITGDKIATNFFQAALARIGTAFIDEAMIGTVNAASIRTGELAAGQRIIAGPANGTHAEMTSTGFRVFAEDPLDNIPNEVIRLGTDTNDYFAVTKADGSYAATIDDTGRASLEDLFVSKDPTFMGKKLISDIIGDLPRGVVGQGIGIPDKSGIVGETQLFGVRFNAVAGRHYRAIISGLRWANAASGIGNGATFLVRLGGSGVEVARGEFQAGPGWNSDHSMVVEMRGGLPSGDTVLVLSCAASGSAVHAQYSASYPYHMVIEDIGPTIAESGQTYAIVTPEPSRLVYQETIPASWSQAYVGGSTVMSNAAGRLYQGQDPSGTNGNLKSLIGFPDLTAKLSGATVNSVELFLYASHWYNNSGGTAIIGAHALSGQPGTFSGTIDPNRIQSGGWPKPGGRVVDITAWGNEFKAGSVRGVVLGPGPSTSLEYYGYFNGVGQAYAPELRINYTK